MSTLSFFSPDAANSPDPSGVFLGLGSNLAHFSDPPHVLISKALNDLHCGGDRVLDISTLWTSDAWPTNAKSPAYFNAACRIQPSDTSPENLLTRLHAIEAKFGRQREPQNRWVSRTLDLDLLDYNGLTLKNSSFLELPHPRIHMRDFVLEPLLEISPHWMHPLLNVSGQQLLHSIKSKGDTNNCRPAPQAKIDRLWLGEGL